MPFSNFFMEVAKQNSRRRRKRRRKPSIDRLSDLPDSILCHILSFLPTRISVATSILGKRWRYLWSYVPTLEFDHKDENIIDRVLLLHKLQTIDTFRLCEGLSWVSYELEKWIAVAVDRNVQTIDIYITDIVALPRCLFTCQTLVYLRLDSCGYIFNVENIDSVVVFLPRLKKLHLNVINPETDGETGGYLSHLLSGCPVIEELVVKLNVYYYSCRISSPTIKRLTVELQCDSEESDYEDDYYNRLEIDTPALAYLELCDCATQYIKCGALNSLIEADISIYGYYVETQDDLLYARSVVEFVDKLRNIKCLKLYLSNRTKIIDSVFSTWTISFHNLTKLELTDDCHFLSKLLESAHNLEILILKEVWKGIESWMEPQQVPTCLLSRLRIIKIVDTMDMHPKFKILKYLLKNAKVLERMEIVHPSFITSEQKIYMLKEISMFRRGSSVCEVAFVQGSFP